MANQVGNTSNNTASTRFDSNKRLPGGALPTRNGVKGQRMGGVARTDVTPQDTFESTQNTAQAQTTQGYTVSISQEAKALSASNVTTEKAPIQSEWQHGTMLRITAEEIAAARSTSFQVPDNVRFGSTSIIIHENNQRREEMQTNDGSRAFGLNGVVAYSFTTVEGSFLLNMDDGALAQYFSLLFRSSTENANFMMENGGIGIQFNGWYANTVENSIVRHAELRHEILRVFGDDKERLFANLRALDNAFEGNMRRIARDTAMRMEHEERMAQARERGTATRPIEPHALASHRNFNATEFERNATEKMNQFARFHLGQINRGVNFNDAMQATMSFMNNMFGLTTSVNNLSFNDFFYLHVNATSGTATTAEAISVERNMLNIAFNNSTNLSPELRALLNS